MLTPVLGASDNEEDSIALILEGYGLNARVGIQGRGSHWVGGCGQKGIEQYLQAFLVVAVGECATSI